MSGDRVLLRAALPAADVGRQRKLLPSSLLSRKDNASITRPIGFVSRE